jgi:hypothetical protein
MWKKTAKPALDFSLRRHGDTHRDRHSGISKDNTGTAVEIQF